MSYWRAFKAGSTSKTSMSKSLRMTWKLGAPLTQCEEWKGLSPVPETGQELSRNENREKLKRKWDNYFTLPWTICLTFMSQWMLDRLTHIGQKDSALKPDEQLLWSRLTRLKPPWSWMCILLLCAIDMICSKHITLRICSSNCSQRHKSLLYSI